MSILRIGTRHAAGRHQSFASRLSKAQRRWNSGEDEFEENSGQKGIEEFVGTHILEVGFGIAPPNPGRSWKKGELEKKGYEDLRRIWFQLVKEKNQLRSIELFYQHQEETLGEFPHASRFDRVAVSMRGIKEVIEERHTVATKVAWKEFLKRVQNETYRFPPGPQTSLVYDQKGRVLTLFSKTRLIEDEVEFNSDDENWEKLTDKLSLILNADVTDVNETLTAEGLERQERFAFVKGRLMMLSRNLLPRKDDLANSWRAEKKALIDEGPWQYTITLSNEVDAEKVLQAAKNKEDEVALLEVLNDSATIPLFDQFNDSDHLMLSPEVTIEKRNHDEHYKHIMAREEWVQQGFTRPAPVRPAVFHKNPSGIDPYTKYVSYYLFTFEARHPSDSYRTLIKQNKLNSEKRSSEHNASQAFFEFAGEEKVCNYCYFISCLVFSRTG